jgi:Predicted ATPase/kinase involved in NAD metabolism
MDHTRFLVTTGPESSGKTTLATALAQHLGAPLVEECSRGYLNERLALDTNWRYQESDLHGIALAQRAAEIAVSNQQQPWIVCDTDLLVLYIWSLEKYARVAPDLERLIKESLQEPRLFLLCSPDMPWEPDPLRENPTDRWRLFDRYLQALQSFALPHLVLAGPPDRRLRDVLSHIDCAHLC